MISLEERKAEILKKLECQHPNDFPLGWRELTTMEFANSQFRAYSWAWDEYRQMIPETSEKRPAYLTYNKWQKRDVATTLCARLFFYDDGTGLAIVADGYNDKAPVRFFAFGCEHDYHELSSAECHKRGIYHAGRCWHVNECLTCKHVLSYDSSD